MGKEKGKKLRKEGMSLGWSMGAECILVKVSDLIRTFTPFASHADNESRNEQTYLVSWVGWLSATRDQPKGSRKRPRLRNLA
jgi:hypothetical protein